MQSAPPELSNSATSNETSSYTQPISQHGLQDTLLSPSGSLNDRETAGRDESSEIEADAVSISSTNTHRGRPSNSSRLSSRDDSSQDGSPGSRIDEYEKAHRKQRKFSSGMMFQVIPSSKDKPSTLSIEDFPSEVLTHILSHLPPDTLSAMSLVSSRFHELVTSPPAWRIAFARYFSGAELETRRQAGDRTVEDIDLAERRAFTRVSALASWRSEYILRTRLLRSLGRGRPAVQPTSRVSSPRQSSNSAGAAVVTYASSLLYPVSHVHATFGMGLNKKQPFFMHGAVEQGAVSSSDPIAGKTGSWGLTDFEGFKHFADGYVGEPEFGLGPGDLVGMPNVMDLSQPYGRLYGEALPGGRLFYTAATEQRGRFLPIASTANHPLGIPGVSMLTSAICSVWIAKSEPILKLTNGLLGCMAGFSNGVLEAFALGVNPVHDRRYEKGEPTARWVLCPGVPIIAIAVDDKISSRRVAAHRVWAVALNALGEIFYLDEIPVRPDFKGKASPSDVERLAWQTGRTTEWKLVESTRRVARPDPFSTAAVDGSYSPRISSDQQGLSIDQIIGETKEVEQFLILKPKHFQRICEGWDMRRRLIADFAGDDGSGAGEAMFIIACGLDENLPASIRKICRQRVRLADYEAETWPAISEINKSKLAIGCSGPTDQDDTTGLQSTPRSRTSSNDDLSPAKFKQDWYITNYAFGDFNNLQISAVVSDESEFAVCTTFEDPLLSMSLGSQTSTPIGSPFGAGKPVGSASEIPGQRARLLAVGTANGLVLLWDMRAGLSPASDVINTVQPCRVILTKSPQISSLALTALYVVHGGNDGLVQAWDPLASTFEPIRTLNSRFSDRARRRIAQAEASIQGVGNNYYAAGAIVLDPDPTVLRGLVSLGTRLRYWSYSSAGAEAYKSRKRGQMRRRSERGSNSSPAEQKVTVTGRGVLRDYIADEKRELEREKVAKRREAEKLSGRFGVDLLGAGATEEEMLAYAAMLSEEAFTKDEEKRTAVDAEAQQVLEKSGQSATSRWSNSSGEGLDTELEEAIRLSLLENERASSPQRNDFNIPIRYTKGSRQTTPSKKSRIGSAEARTPTAVEDDDLEFALQLSLAEEQSRHGTEDEFPSLDRALGQSPGMRGKGKGRSR